MWRRHDHTEELYRRLHKLEERIEDVEASQNIQQSDLDTLTQQVEQVSANLATATQQVQTELDALEQQIQSNTPTQNLDLTPLRDAVANLDAQAQSVGSLAPTPTPPAPQDPNAPTG